VNFDRTEQQRLLDDSFDRLIRRDYGFDQRARILASARGVSDEIWAAFADMGLLGMTIPAEYGGFGGGAEDLVGVMEAIGEALVVEPYLSTIGLGARIVLRGGSEPMKRAVLPAIAEGSLKIALAQLESGGRYDLATVRTSARRTASGWVLRGEKRLVIQGQNADCLVVSARVAGGENDRLGIALFLVDTRGRGVMMKTFRTVDGSRAADVELNDVEVGDDALICGGEAGFTVLEEAIDFATVLLCSEALGAVRYANEATLDYVKTRKQFGVTIGSFQAVQHRLVDMFIAHEQLKSLVYLASSRIDAEWDAAERRRAISGLKIKACDVCRQISQESVQFHGGIGLTDELKISHTFRRLTVIAQEFGDADHHLQRYSHPF
jgi:alkylation response protein AidB-like acyl-CoA dehydrogenase